jgi:hypothetical protein
MSDLRIVLWFTWFLVANWFARLNLISQLHYPKRGSLMKRFSPLLVFFLGLGIFAGTATTASAQNDDPPTRVARLNYIQGSVSFQPGGEDEWIAADPNRPLTTGDNLWADQNSRGEVHIGSTSIRLSSVTGISFLNLDDRTVQLQLAQGTIEIHLRHYEPGNAFEIDTPNLAFTLVTPGEYRIETDPNGNSTMIIIREGQGQVTAAGESYELDANQEYFFNGTDQLTVDAQPAPGFDDFENWSQSRDQRENASGSARYVSRDIDGYYDLDDNGDWQNDPEYGAIWIPRGVAVGWAPYHDGHWVWINPWGWTWVDSQPWGFAPFHYGRWAYVRGYWGWVPGPVVVRPVYAPALVAFVGGGPGGFGVSVGFGGGFAGVAWFPLGPRDVYLPSYRCSARYVQNVNVTNSRVVNVTQVTNVYNTYHVTNITVNNVTVNNVTVNRVNYTYANNAAAVTAVSRETFVGAKPVQASAVRVTPEQLQSVHIVEAAPLAPTRASYVSATARVTPQSAKPPVAFTQKKVVARLAPPPPPANHGVAPRVVSAEAPPKGGPPAPRATEAAAAKTTQPMQAAPRSNNMEPAPKASEPAARSNPPTPANNEPARTAPYEQQGSNNQQRPAEPKPNPVEKPIEQPTYQQHPAVKYTPPTRAKDENYDVHPPLNDKKTAPPPQAEKKEAAPVKEPAPSKEKPPKEKDPKNKN